MSKKEPASLNRNTDKYVFALLLQQSVELLINLSAVPGPLRAWQDPRKGAEEDTGSHSSKDVHRGMCFPLRSYQVPLTLLPSKRGCSSAWTGHNSFHTIFPTKGWGSYGNTVCLSVFLPVPVVGADSQVSYRSLSKCAPIPLVSNHSTPVWTTTCSHWALLHCAVIKKSWVLFKYRAFCPKPSSACGCE